MQAGEVKCASPDCPKLPCMHQVTDPGACCPRCRGRSIAQEVSRAVETVRVTPPPAPTSSGCMYGGQEHAEGSSWFAGSTPCMTCMCADGVTTCSEIRCLSPCINFINVPGECCPVCAGKRRGDGVSQVLFALIEIRWTCCSTDCVFEGRVYGPGDSFHPAGDPCQICTCEVCHTI